MFEINKRPDLSNARLSIEGLTLATMVFFAGIAINTNDVAQLSIHDEQIAALRIDIHGRRNFEAFCDHFNFGFLQINLHDLSL